jgi:hypothetical protein
MHMILDYSAGNDCAHGSCAASGGIGPAACLYVNGMGTLYKMLCKVNIMVRGYVQCMR